MLLRATVWDDEAWFAQVVPLLERVGLTEREDLHTADPKTDGELMDIYFDLSSELAVPDLVHLVEQTNRIMSDAKAQPVKLVLVPPS